MTGIQAVVATLLMGLLACLPPQALARDAITVRAGYTELLRVPGVTRVSVGNGQLAEVKTFEDTSEILFIGTVPGRTDVRVWVGQEPDPKRYTLIVTSGRPAIRLKQLKQIIDPLEGITVKSLGNGFLVTGEALRPDDKALVAALAKRYPEIQDQVKGPTVVAQPTVNISAKVVEIRRSGTEDLGIDWDQSINGPEAAFVSDVATNSLFRPAPPPGLNLAAGGLTDLGTRGFLGFATRIGSIINLLSKDGVARLLAEPHLSVSSGSQARLVVGGQLPITALDDQGQIQTSFKDFGVILEVSPVVDGADGLIQTALSVEVSSIDPSVTVNGVPGTVSRSTKTQVSLHSGESFVVSGLLSQESSDETSRVPGIGNLPVVGGLFRNQSRQSRETELIVVIQPTLVSPLDPVNERRLERFQSMVEGTRRRVSFADMGGSEPAAGEGSR